jgi:hypothetical protein
VTSYAVGAVSNRLVYLKWLPSDETGVDIDHIMRYYTPYGLLVTNRRKTLMETGEAEHAPYTFFGAKFI